MAAGLIGPGRLLAVVGPSGAGKDTLIARARTRLAGDPMIVFPLRIVTRAASARKTTTPFRTASSRPPWNKARSPSGGRRTG
jgi:ribose 1,5-bisphosphokinase PhnN